ncbi:MAG: Hint domain-containing protein [Myxococcota bacterium]
MRVGLLCLLAAVTLSCERQREAAPLRAPIERAPDPTIATPPVVTKLEAVVTAVAAPEGGWSAPWVSADRTHRGVTVGVAVEHLDPAVASIAIVARKADDDRDYALDCREAWVVRDVSARTLRALEPHVPEQTSVVFDLGPDEVESGARYLVGACPRDATGQLHRPRDPSAFGVYAGVDRWWSVVATPSGWVMSHDVQAGHHVWTLDRARRSAVAGVVRDVTSVEYRTERTLRMSGGTHVVTPSERLYAVADRRRFAPAHALNPGDVLIAFEGGRQTVVAASDVLTVETRREVFDVLEADAYFLDGFLVRDSGPAEEGIVWSPQPSPGASVAFGAVPGSADCMLRTRLHVSAEHRGAITLHVADHHGAPGMLSTPDCSSDTRVVTLPESALAVALGDAAIARHGLALEQWQEEGIECTQPYALTACAGERALGAARYGLSGAACLAHGTPIDTPRGAVPVETLRRGQAIYGYDTDLRRRVIVHVQRIRESRQKVGTISLHDGGTLHTTAAHLFYVPGADAYRPAADLGPRGHLWTRRGPIAISSIGGFEREARVVDISVDGPSNYFAAGVLVHNY